MLAIIILVMGLLAMTSLFTLAWWLWVHDPKWPWTHARAPGESPPRSQAAPHLPVTPPGGPPPEVEPAHTMLLPPPASSEDVSERRRTELFVKTEDRSDRTQILPEMASFAIPASDDDAPMARVEQMQTRPVARASQRRRRPPPQPPRS